LAHYRYKPSHGEKRTAAKLDELSPAERETLEAISQVFGMKVYVETSRGEELIAFRHY
jgi:hypothetical protein